jgi:predicted site-specific integrase-resolvase
MEINDEADLELLDIKEQAEEVGFLTPREYAKIRGIAPQMVYYHIRNKRIEVEHCRCGRKIINVEEADKVFESRKRKTDTVDKRSDQERE